MKHYIHLTALMGIAIILAGAATACQKDPGVEFNPPVDETLPATPFSLTGVEERGSTGATFDWTISSTGVTDSVSEELDEMTVTAYNNLIISATPKNNATAFSGINARSSNVNAVQVEMIGKTQFKDFKLKYVGDGEATIKVWNGKEGENTTVEFKVKSVKEVPVEGLRFLLYDEVVVAKHITEMRPSFQIDWNRGTVNNERGAFKLRFNHGPAYKWPDPEKLPYIDYLHYDCNHYSADVVFLGLEPENATWRQVVSLETNLEEWCGVKIEKYLENRGRNIEDYSLYQNLFVRKKDVSKDVSELFGVRGILTPGYTSENAINTAYWFMSMGIQTEKGIIYASALRNVKFDNQEHDVNYICPHPYCVSARGQKDVIIY